MVVMTKIEIMMLAAIYYHRLSAKVLAEVDLSLKAHASQLGNENASDVHH